MTNTVWAIIYFIVSPVIFLAKILLSLFTTLLAPIIHLGRLALYLVLIPVRILAKFEVSLCDTRDLYPLPPSINSSEKWRDFVCSVSRYRNELILIRQSLFIFLGWAILLGCLAGLFLHVIHRSFGRALRLSGPFPELHGKQKRRNLIGDFTTSHYFSTRDRPKGEVDDNMASASPQSTRKMLSSEIPPGTYSNDSKYNDFHTEWMSGKERTPMKESGLFSTTILEEEDDNNDSDDY